MQALIGGGVAALLSLIVLSRAVGDNPAFRVVQHLFIGLSLGYVAAVLLRSAGGMLTERLIARTVTPVDWVVLGVSAVLLLMLLTRFGRQRLSTLANYPIAVLFGAGAALALAGAVRGTLVPQMIDTMRLSGLESGDWTAQIGAVVLAALTITTLFSFMYSTRVAGQSRWGRLNYGFGRGLILLTFGVFFAAALTTYIAALVGQVSAIIQWVNLVVGSM